MDIALGLKVYLNDEIWPKEVRKCNIYQFESLQIYVDIYIMVHQDVI